MDADSLEVGTRVQVETVYGCLRGVLTRPLEPGTDVELRCAGHVLRLRRSCVRRVLSLQTPAPPP